MKRRQKLGLAALTLILTLGLAATVQAAEPEARGRLMRGEVTAIANEALTVQTPNDEVTLGVDEATIFQIPGVENPTLDDLNVGDFTVILAARDESGEHVARHVLVIPDGCLKDRVLLGIVSEVNGATFQLRTGRGKVLVTTDAHTLFWIPGVKEPTAADLAARMPVIVTGQFQGESETLHASAVAAIPGRVLKRHAVRGDLRAVEGDTLVLTNGDETTRVRTTDETAFRVPGVENATIDDLNEGDPILALGNKDENGDLDAKIVSVMPPRLRRVKMRGEVTAVGDASLALETPQQGEVTLLVSKETRFRVPGVEEPGLDDIATGDHVAAIAYENPDGDLVALAVGVLPEKLRGHAVRGEVTAIEGATLQIDAPRGQVTVHTSEDTRFRVPGVEAPTLNDLSVGDAVAAAGRWNEDGSMQALVVGVLPARR